MRLCLSQLCVNVFVVKVNRIITGKKESMQLGVNEPVWGFFFPSQMQFEDNKLNKSLSPGKVLKHNMKRK